MIIQAGAPGETNRIITEEEASAISAVPHGLADAEFMQGMIHHHGQALVMTAYAAENSGGDQIPLLAERMEIGQQSEIDLMAEWLQSRSFAVPSTDPADHVEHSDEPLMPGMLTDAQLEELRVATGPEFDRLFLRYMIQHHVGALQMVDELVAANGGQEVESGRIAQDIYADQEIEILRMQALLDEMPTVSDP
ncbi:DUF305 domain-containing protein [Ilumatobacter sp.]|uniref:DUF305 domain-containing protein n=1 Tax=Ilumatobacter sp. TaxID=1967498 RepID=UPI003C510EAF